MLVLISPSKAQDFEEPSFFNDYSHLDFKSEAKELIGELRKLKVNEIGELMSLSEKLSLLNYERYQNYSSDFSEENAKQAIMAFKGDVYTGFQLEEYNDKDFEFAQNHLRILSGLYGLLRPLDLIQPYRLEMKIKLNNSKGKNLYSFWGAKIAEKISHQLSYIKSDTLVNLASNEYFKAVDRKVLSCDILTPVFKEKKGDKYKVVAFFAKKARGAMSDFIIKNKITDIEKLKSFEWGNYQYNSQLSSGKEWVFTRG